MQYMLLNYTKPADVADASQIAAAAAGEVWGAYTQALIDAGVFVSGEALHASDSATTLRVKGGARDIHDGPYADTKEQLGGYYIIDVPDLDSALMWAARNPAADRGAVEIRPIVQRG